MPLGAHDRRQVRRSRLYLVHSGPGALAAGTVFGSRPARPPPRGGTARRREEAVGDLRASGPLRGPHLPAGHSCGCREAGGRGPGPFAAALTAQRLGRARRLGRASSRRSRCRACSLLSNIGPSNLGRRRHMAASCLLSRSSTRRDQVEASSKRRSDARRGLTAHILRCC